MGVKGKYFMIGNEPTGLVLEVRNASDSSGSKVIMGEQNGTDSQLWYEDPVTGTIRSKYCHLCLDFNAKNRLVINEYQSGDSNQQWHYNKARTTIEKDSETNKVFDVYRNSTDPGAKICAYEHHGGNNQHWKIIPVETSRYFFIKSAMNGKVLDVQGESRDSGAKVIMYDQKDPGGADNQLWFEDRYGNIRSKLNPLLVLDANGDCVHTGEFELGDRKLFWCVVGNKIVNRHHPDQVLDVKAENSDNGAELCCWDYKGSDNQHWHIEFV